MPQSATIPHTDDELVSRLARLDELAESGQAIAAADATVASLKAELDTFVAALRESPPADDLELEPAFGKVTAMVQAIGRDPDELSDKTIDTQSETGKPSATAETPLGTLGIYELLSKLGEGGMGAVYKARHTKLDKIVAIKVLPADRMKDKSAVARFEREMRAVGKLEHPNIVRAMDAGEAGGMHYLVMEYVQGVDLSQLVKERGPLPIADACELIRQAAVGLDEAHDSHMVHRDIKPSNIMLCVVSKRKPPVVKILDMGLALLSEAHSADVQGLTTTGQMMGTLDYMAPEQGGDSKNVDIRADIYALGASLYKLLCGEAIYHGPQYQTPVQKMMALATHPAPPIQKRRKGVPNELTAMLHRMLEKNPDKRIATPEEVAQALAPFCAGANLAALLNSAGFDVAPTPDASLSKTQPSFSQPDAETGVSVAPAKAAPPLKVAKPIGPGATGGSPTSAAAPKAKPPVAPVDKSNPSLAKAPAPKSSPATARVDKPPVPPSAKSPAPVPHIQTKPTQAKSLAKTAAGRKLPPWVPLAIGGGLLGFGGIVALAAAIVFFFQTPNGTLRVEINDPSIEVTVKGTDIVLKQTGKEEITLTPGEHALVVKRGDFSFETRNFELKKGETTIVKVDLLGGEVRVVSNGAAIGNASVTTPPRTPSSEYYVLHFDGKSSYVSTPLKVDSAGDFTYETWAKARDPRHQLLVSNFDDGAGGASLEIFGDPANWTFAVATGGNFAHLQAQSPDAQWHHLAGVKQGREYRFYLDGQLVSTQTVASSPSSARTVSIGASNSCPGSEGRNWVMFFDGELDEVRVSKVARYKTNFEPPRFHLTDADTLALYHFDEGQGDELRDSSGNHHHGKIVGAKWVRASASESYNGENALNFTGGGIVEVPSLKLPLEGELTIEAYVTARKTSFGSGTKDEQIRLVGQEGTAKLAIIDGHWNGYAFHNGVTDKQPAPTNTRTHLALVRTASQKRLYANGRLIDSLDVTGWRVDEDPTLFQIGQKEFDGVIDEVRVSKVARYDKDFTPAQRFEADQHTIAIYHCDEGQGDKVLDSSGNNHHGTFTGAKWLKGESVPLASPDYALRFRVTNKDVPQEFVTLPNVGFDRAGPVTIEAFCTPDDVASGSILDVVSPTMTLVKGKWVLTAIHEKPLLFSIIEGPVAIPNRRVHIAGVRDGTELRLYVDGKQAGKKALPATAILGNANSFQLGTLFSGVIDEVRFSNSVRYTDDFTPETRFKRDADTLALYHFDEGQGDVLVDSSGNEHHGKITGAKWVKGDDTNFADQAAVARWLLENKKIANIGFEIDGQVQSLNAVPSGPCKVRELSFHTANNGGKLLEEDIPRLAVFTDLEYLDVSRSPLTDAGLASLAALKKLKRLSVMETGITPPSVATIRAFPQLESVHTPSSDDWLRPLAGMPSIRTLFYYRQDVSPQAMEWFKQYPNLTELRFAECGADWTNEKLAPLQDCKQLSKLEVSYTPIDDASVEFFSSLKGLVELNVTETKITEEGVKKIAAALPACKITWTGGVIEPTVAAKNCALEFDGKTSLVNIPTLSWDGTPRFTVEAWIQSPANPGNVHILTVDGASRYQLFRIGGLWAGGMAREGGIDQIYFGANKNTHDRLTHVAYVADDKTCRFYENGKLLGKQTFATPKYKTKQSPGGYFGGMPGRQFMFRGRIDEVRFSRVPRYVENFTPAARFETDANTTALYHCDEGEGDVLRDASGNKHHGKIVGAKWVKLDVTPTPDAVGFVPLFNDDDLTGWNALRSASIDWKNEGGTITGRNRSGSPNAAGVLQSQKKYRDFHFRCEILAGSGAEPALLFRSGGRLVKGDRHGYALTNPVPRSPSIAEGWGYGSLYADDFQVPPEQCRLAPAAEKDLGIKTGDWFRLEIIAQGEVVEIRVNGRETVRYTSSDPALNGVGSLSLRCHAGTTVAFRNVEIKELPASNAAAAPPANLGHIQPAAHWVNLLPLIDSAIDAGGDGGKREGNEILIGHRSTLALPLSMAGSWELRGEFTVSAGPKILSVACPIAGTASSVILSEADNEAGYAGCGISGIDRLPAIDARNPSHNAAKLVETDKRHALVITATSAGDQVTIRATVDGKTLADWTGAASRLNAAAANSTNQIAFSSYKGMLRLHTLELKMLDGEAKLLRP